MIPERTPQFDRALDQRVVGDEAVRPNRPDELLLANQAAWIQDQVLQRFVNLGAEFHFLCSPKQASPPHV